MKKMTLSLMKILTYFSFNETKKRLKFLHKLTINKLIVGVVDKIEEFTENLFIVAVWICQHVQ